MTQPTTVQVVVQTPNEVAITELKNTVTVNESDPTEVYVAIPGVQGPRGTGILSGSGLPSNATGINGDFYLDTATQRLYGPKASGVWSTGSYIQLASQTNRHVHTQSSVSATWTINHSLGGRPSVSIVDSAGTVVIGEVTYVSDSQVVVNFSAPFSGYAYLT